ncbi:MAG: ABC transporter permease [Candidatus Kapabacteria bacterium]|nr:ABC transporter permease [Ignavibacteriota bacterium]MCW5883809.1 ABC transporter permease [Candidatus Kapabacteria bacterium]
MIASLGYNLKIAAEAILQNKVRSVLTSLGIIFGVASVISMLAIGSGAEQEILEKMKLLGTNNIIIKPLDSKRMAEIQKEEENDEANSDQKSTSNRFSPGLNLLDMQSLKKIIPGISHIAPEIVIEVTAMREGKKRDVNLVGVNSDYFVINNFSITSGTNFNSFSFEKSENVCIIGSGISKRLFPTDNPIGQIIKCGEQWLTVIGEINEKNISKDNIQNLGIRDYNLDVYIPISTMLMRFNNRSLVTKADLQRRGRNQPTDENYHQIDKLTVAFRSSEEVQPAVEIIRRLLDRRHNTVKDFEIVVPELLLEQEQSTKRIFNIVLGAIASISLIVGGIGIMNIMLASVLERTKEIGIRKAVGAKRADIMLQFLSEAVAISVSGGIIGIILGVSAGVVIELLTDIKTIVSPFSVILSFVVSISVGLIFGITPARRASMQDTIELLRYE